MIIEIAEYVAKTQKRVGKEGERVLERSGRAAKRAPSIRRSLTAAAPVANASPSRQVGSWPIPSSAPHTHRRNRHERKERSPLCCGDGS